METNYKKPSIIAVKVNPAGLVTLAAYQFVVPPEDCGYKTTPDSFVEKTCVTLDSQFTKGLNINNLNTNFQYPGVTVQIDDQNQCTADLILVGQGSQVTMQVKPTGQIAIGKCQQGNDVQTTASLSGDKYCIDIDQQFTLIFSTAQGSVEDNGRVKPGNPGNNVNAITLERTDTGDKSDTSQACTGVNDPNW